MSTSLKSSSITTTAMTMRGADGRVHVVADMSRTEKRQGRDTRRPLLLTFFANAD